MAILCQRPCQHQNRTPPLRSLIQAHVGGWFKEGVTEPPPPDRIEPVTQSCTHLCADQRFLTSSATVVPQVMCSTAGRDRKNPGSGRLAYQLSNVQPLRPPAWHIARAEALPTQLLQILVVDVLGL